MTHNAFTDAPPTVTIDGNRIELRPMLAGFRKVFPILAELFDGAELGVATISAYIILHDPTLTPAQSAALLDDKEAFRASINLLEWQIPADDVRAVDAYLSRVWSRYAEAQVETPEGESK